MTGKTTGNTGDQHVLRLLCRDLQLSSADLRQRMQSGRYVEDLFGADDLLAFGRRHRAAIARQIRHVLEHYPGSVSHFNAVASRLGIDLLASPSDDVTYLYAVFVVEQALLLHYLSGDAEAVAQARRAERRRLG